MNIRSLLALWSNRRWLPKRDGATAGSSSKDTPLQDFLEKYASDGFKRELDFDEAVWRSLPAFVTAIGLLAALLAYEFIHLATADWRNLTNLLGLGLTVCGALSTLAALWHLRFAIKTRRHRYPADEQIVRVVALGRLDELVKHGLTPEEAEAQALTETRKNYLDDIAAAASHNHGLNAAKLVARTKSARWLIIAAAFTLIAGSVTVFLQTPLAGANSDERHNESAPSASAATPAAATAAAAALGGKGRNDPAEVPVD